MEGDDGTIADVPLHIIDDILGGHPFRIVASDEVPHHNLIPPTEPGILRHAHPAMGRTDIVALDISIGLLYIIAVLLDRVEKALDMIVGVIAHLMPFGKDTLVEVGVFTHIIAHHKECGPGPKLFQSPPEPVRCTLSQPEPDQPRYTARCRPA